jgi:hypothetical protein
MPLPIFFFNGTPFINISSLAKLCLASAKPMICILLISNLLSSLGEAMTMIKVQTS